LSNKITWGSHIPLHKSIFNVLPISGSVEFGAGVHSTKVFFENTPFAISVETDEKWVEHVKENVGEDDNHKIYHVQTPIQRADRERNVDKRLIDDAIQKCTNLINQHNEINHMFVDSISSLRYRLLTELNTKFDVVTFHDYWTPGFTNHYRGGWAMKNPDYQMYIDKTYQNHTGLLVHKSLLKMIPNLIVELQKQVEEYHPSTANLVKIPHGNKS